MSGAPGVVSSGSPALGSTARGSTASGNTALGNTAADLRLVPPALAVWLTAALLLGASPWWTAGVVLCAAVGAVALLVPWRPSDGRTAARRVTWAAVLLCVAASAAAAGLHGADLWRGPVPELADRYAAATFEVEVAADPRRARPRPTGAAAPPLVLVDARVVRVTAADGAVTRTRTPVLLMVDAGRAPGRWLEVLPSTRLRVMGRLAPPQRRGGDIAAVVRVDGEGPPRVVAPPSAVQRIAGELRTGLRRATAGLPEDARALLPGLVVGDTSRVTPELRESFERTDLTHLMAVSGSNFVVLLALLVGPPGMSQSVERRGWRPGSASDCGRRRSWPQGSVSGSSWCADRSRVWCGRRPAAGSRCSRWSPDAGDRCCPRWRRPCCCWCSMTRGWPGNRASCCPSSRRAPCSRWRRGGAPHCGGAVCPAGSPRRWRRRPPPRRCARR